MRKSISPDVSTARRDTAPDMLPDPSDPGAAGREPTTVPPKLTDRQREILNLIERAIVDSGAPPTRAEIARELGFRSANAAEDHLQALSRKGVIDLVGGTSRGIRLRPQPGIAAQAPRQRTLPLAGIAQLCLPLVGRVAAGHPILAQQHIDRSYTVEAHLFSSRPDYLLTVHGMSMCKAGIVDGDLLAVRQSKTARDGQIVVARLGDDVTVKRLRRSKGWVELVPENDDFDVISVRADDDGFDLEGIVVGLIRRSL